MFKPYDFTVWFLEHTVNVRIKYDFAPDSLYSILLLGTLLFWVLYCCISIRWEAYGPCVLYGPFVLYDCSIHQTLPFILLSYFIQGTKLQYLNTIYSTSYDFFFF